MADENTTPTPTSVTPASPTTPPAEGTPPPAAKFVGKYESQDAFEQGIREAAKMTGREFAADTKIIGSDGIFRDIKEAEVGYKALQRMAARQAPAAKPGDPAPNDPPAVPVKPTVPANKPEDQLAIDDVPITPDADVNTVLQAVGVTAEDISQQWTTNGKLDDATYQKFAAKGYPRALVDSYLHGQAAEAQALQAQVQTIRQTVTQSLGGEQAESTLRDWARSELKGKDPTFDDLNAAVDANPRLYPALMNYVQTRHAAAIGSTGSRPLVNGGGSPPTSVTPINNRQEYFAVNRAARRGDATAIARLKAHIAAGGSRFS